MHGETRLMTEEEMRRQDFRFTLLYIVGLLAFVAVGFVLMYVRAMDRAEQINRDLRDRITVTTE